MKTTIKKKLVIYSITLGLSLSGFCLNLLAPGAAMAMTTTMATPATPAPAMQEKAPETMPMTGKIANCGKNIMTNLNCCLVPIHAGSDKALEIKTPHAVRQHLHTPGIKVEPLNICRINTKNQLHPFQNSNGLPPNFTGQIVKRE